MKNQYAGGLIGIAKGTTHISGSHVFPLIGTGKECAHGSSCGFGGLIGYAASAPRGGGATTEGITIDQSWAYGGIDTKYNSGGLVGLVATTAAIDIKDSYSYVKLMCDSKCSYAGGLVGKALPGSQSVSAEDIYIGSTLVFGSVSPSGENGGKAVIGAEGSSAVSRVGRLGSRKSFFDKEATGKDNSGDNVSEGKGTGGMKEPDNYDSSWTRSIWNIDTKPNNEYPDLIHNPFPD